MAIDHKAACSCCDGGEINGGVGSFAKDHIAAAGVRARSRIAVGGTNDEISKAITVDITSTGDAAAAAVVSGLAIDDKAPVTSGDGGEVDGDAGIKGLTCLGRSGVVVACPVGAGTGGHIDGDGAGAAGAGCDQQRVVGTGAREGALAAAGDVDVVSGEAGDGF